MSTRHRVLIGATAACFGLAACANTPVTPDRVRSEVPAGRLVDGSHLVASNIAADSATATTTSDAGSVTVDQSGVMFGSGN